MSDGGWGNQNIFQSKDMPAGSKWDLVNLWIIVLRANPSGMQVKDPLNKKITQLINILICEKDQRDVFFSVRRYHFMLLNPLKLFI